MATSPLLQMPILNGITTAGFDEINNDPTNKPTPYNIFGSVGAGYRQHQDAPMELYFLGNNVYGTERTHDGDGSPCDRGKTTFQVWDFNNLLSAQISATRDSPPIPRGGQCFPVRESWFIEDKRGRANYSGTLPPIRPYYGEAGSRFQRFVQLYNDSNQLRLYPWRAGTLDTSYSPLMPLVAYSRFATDHIRDFFSYIVYEWRGIGDGYENNIWGFSESPDLVPFAWGARRVTPVRGPYAGVWNLDTFFGYLYSKGIRNWQSLRSFYYRLKGQGWGGGYQFFDEPNWYTAGYATWWSQCWATLLVTRCGYKWNWDNLVVNDPVFHWARVNGLSGSEFAGITRCYTCFTSACYREQFEQRAFILLAYLFDSTRCYRKNPRTGGDFYVNLPVMWQTFNNQGVYCKDYYAKSDF